MFIVISRYFSLLFILINLLIVLLLVVAKHLDIRSDLVLIGNVVLIQLLLIFLNLPFKSH